MRESSRIDRKGMSLSASCRYYRIGNGLFGKYKIFDRSWDHPQRGDRKYDPGFFDRRSGRRDSKRKAYIKTLGLRKGGIEVVSCPTCGRTKIDLIGLANEVEKMVQDIPLDIKVAVMGCVVNGPGEAREADIGIAGGIGEGLLIKKGEIIKKVKEEKLLETLRQELLNWKK